MTLAFIGIGNVGFALANNLNKAGHEIIIATNSENSESVQNALIQNPKFRVMPLQKAIDESEIIFLATPFKVNEALLKSVVFSNKTLVDCTNPVGPGLSHGLHSVISGSEKIQEWAPTSNVIKAFTIYGFENLQDTKFPQKNTRPVMLIAGNHNVGKSSFAPMVSALGFEVKDVGPLDQALHLEHLTLLWVKMVRRDGHHPNFAWAYMEK